MAGKRKSHCRNGHAMTGDNVGTFDDGRRFCKTCKADRKRIRRQRYRQGVGVERSEGNRHPKGVVETGVGGWGTVAALKVLHQ